MVILPSIAMFLHFASFLEQKPLCVCVYIYFFFQTTSIMFPVNIQVSQFRFISNLSITTHACLDSDLCFLCFRVFLVPLIRFYTVYCTVEHGVFQVLGFTNLLETEFRES